MILGRKDVNWLFRFIKLAQRFFEYCHGLFRELHRLLSARFCPAANELASDVLVARYDPCWRAAIEIEFGNAGSRYFGSSLTRESGKRDNTSNCFRYRRVVRVQCTPERLQLLIGKHSITCDLGTVLSEASSWRI